MSKFSDEFYESLRNASSDEVAARIRAGGGSTKDWADIVMMVEMAKRAARENANKGGKTAEGNFQKNPFGRKRHSGGFYDGGSAFAGMNYSTFEKEYAARINRDLNDAFNEAVKGTHVNTGFTGNNWNTTGPAFRPDAQDFKAEYEGSFPPEAEEIPDHEKPEELLRQAALRENCVRVTKPKTDTAFVACGACAKPFDIVGIRQCRTCRQFFKGSCACKQCATCQRAVRNYMEAGAKERGSKQAAKAT